MQAVKVTSNTILPIFVMAFLTDALHSNLVSASALDTPIHVTDTKYITRALIGTW